MDETLSGLHVVVLTHGTGEPSIGLVAQVLAEGVAPAQFVVVHNPTRPEDPSPAMPDPSVEIIRTPRNLGYTGGMNTGLAHHLAGDPEWVLVLTHDVRFRAGALRRLMEAGRAADRYGVLGPELFDPSKGIVFSYGGHFHWLSGTRHQLELPDTEDGIVGCDFIDGAFMLMRASALREVGSFDEKLFIYAEECDLCLRMRRAGHRVGVVPGARAEQQVGAPARPGAYAYLMTRNGLNLARNEAGWMGLTGAFGRVGRDAVMYGRRVLDPRRPPASKQAARAAAVGTVRGAAAYVRGRWGPPPANLPGLGDTQGT
jgi:GT2 family glycosyltransferase